MPRSGGSGSTSHSPPAVSDSFWPRSPLGGRWPIECHEPAASKLTRTDADLHRVACGVRDLHVSVAGGDLHLVGARTLARPLRHVFHELGHALVRLRVR